jgi:hypothetical protein
MTNRVYGMTAYGKRCHIIVDGHPLCCWGMKTWPTYEVTPEDVCKVCLAKQERILVQQETSHEA